ncbi:MAG: metallophosphoesterase [Myxococcota bacterium]
MIIFTILAVLSFFVFIVGPALGAYVTWRLARKGSRRAAIIVGALVAVVVAIGIDAFLIEPTSLEVTHVEITSERIEEPLVIAVIADLQTDAPGPYERDVLERVAAAEPDLVLFPGDFVQVPLSEFPARAAELREILLDVGLNPPLGAFAVPGNIEFGNRGWPQSFEGTGIHTWSRPKQVDLGPLVLSGLPLAESFDAGIRIDGEEKFHVVFGHGPDFSLGNVDADLLIAGHTHGGQVQLPFIGPLITFSKVPRDHAAGHNEIEPGKHLVVSRGIGMERGSAPRLRFLCRPELVFIHVKPG